MGAAWEAADLAAGLAGWEETAAAAREAEARAKAAGAAREAEARAASAARAEQARAKTATAAAGEPGKLPIRDPPAKTLS